VSPSVLYADHFEWGGVDLFKTACEPDLEGMVAKLAAGRYEPEAITWVKIKNRTDSQAAGRADFFDFGAARQLR
jgi:ATP-dependent DNA ligase